MWIGSFIGQPLTCLVQPNPAWLEQIRKEAIPRSRWPKGPWTTEPDRVQFSHAGLPCLMLRAEITGAWCGYVGVPEGHPLYGSDQNALDVHGSITYMGGSDPPQRFWNPLGGPCPIPEPIWWLGFDCTHAGDLAPGLTALLRSIGVERSMRRLVGDDVYRDMDWVIGEVRSLAEQLARYLVPTEEQNDEPDSQETGARQEPNL